jgi:hypothetical protein
MHKYFCRVNASILQSTALATSVLSGSNHQPVVLRLRRSPIESDGIVHRWPPAILSRSGYQPNLDNSVGNAPCAIAANDHLLRNRHDDRQSADIGIDSVCGTEFLDGRSALSDSILKMVNL